MSLSLEAVRVQMKIMNALVTGMPMAGTLALVLQALAARFTECVAGIWITGYEKEEASSLTLEAGIGLPHAVTTTIHMHRAEHDEVSELEQHLKDQGITAIDWLAITNTKDRRVGWMGLSFPQMRTLSPAELQVVEQYARVAGLIIEKEQLDQENHFLAYHDYLTEVPNRRLFHMRLAAGIEDAVQSQYPLSLVLLDVNNFKHINDTYGHIAGDKVLQEVARRIAQTLPDGDTVARIGGDEFGLILMGTTGSEALTITHEVLEAIRHPISWQGEICVMASAGIVSCPAHGTNEEELLRRADATLYEAKRSTQFGAKLYAAR